MNTRSPTIIEKIVSIVIGLPLFCLIVYYIATHFTALVGFLTVPLRLMK